MTCIVVDYSKGNLRSVQKALELAGAKAIISAREADIRMAEAIVLPGVGSFADASRVMLATGQMQALRERVEAGIPFLGICLGMQLLFECGDEGMPGDTGAEGLGILQGRCKRIASTDEQGSSFKVPHVGWNQVSYAYGAEKNPGLDHLFAGIEDGSHFYFTHSYGCELADADDLLAIVTHAQAIPSAVCRGSVFGVQFHPEKSSQKGLAVLKNFVWYVKNTGRKTR